MTVSSKIFLKSWSVNTSISDMDLEVRIEDGSFFPIDKPQTAEYSGYYASYPEGVFFILKDTSGKVRIGFHEDVINLDDVTNVMSKVGLAGRSITFSSLNKRVREFRYHTLSGMLKKNILKPIDLFFDVFLDEDWGVNEDLPGWVASVFSSEKKIGHFLEDIY